MSVDALMEQVLGPDPGTPSPDGSAILLVDLSSIAYPIYLTSASESDPNTASTRIIARVRSLATAHPRTAICVDSGKSFRAEIDPTYKAQRPEAEAALHHQIGLAIDALKNDGFPVWSAKGFEADDLICTATARAMEIEDATVVIASSDKDLHSLISPRVWQKSVKDGSLSGEDEVVTKLGVLPFQVPDYLCLVGDASDNIKGAHRIGPKIAAKLLGMHGSIESLYLAIDNNAVTLPPAVIASLIEFRPRLETVRQLVTMRTDAPIPFDEVLAPRVAKDVQPFSFEGEDMEDAILVDPLPEPTGAGPAPEKSDALAVVDALATPVEFERQLEPRSMRDAMVLANHMHLSRMFSDYGSPPAVLSTIMAGRELGMQAMASLRAFHVIEGKPRLSADLIRALVMKSGLAKFFRCTVRAPDRAVFETQRGDDPPISLEYTLQEGRTAFAGKDDAWQKSGWARNPADMCVARAGSKLARLVYPEVTFGLYSVEEMD